jgi:hypothetical protein
MQHAHTRSGPAFLLLAFLLTGCPDGIDSGDLELKVIDQDGVPIGGIEVVACWVNGNCTPRLLTGPDGIAVLENLPWHVRVTASARSLDRPPGTWPLDASTELDIQPGRTNRLTLPFAFNVPVYDILSARIPAASLSEDGSEAELHLSVARGSYFWEEAERGLCLHEQCHVAWSRDGTEPGLHELDVTMISVDSRTVEPSDNASALLVLDLGRRTAFDDPFRLRERAVRGFIRDLDAPLALSIGGIAGDDGAAPAPLLPELPYWTAPAPGSGRELVEAAALDLHTRTGGDSPLVAGLDAAAEALMTSPPGDGRRVLVALVGGGDTRRHQPGWDQQAQALRAKLAQQDIQLLLVQADSATPGEAQAAREELLQLATVLDAGYILPMTPRENIGAGSALRRAARIASGNMQIQEFVARITAPPGTFEAGTLLQLDLTLGENLWGYVYTRLDVAVRVP